MKNLLIVLLIVSMLGCMLGCTKPEDGSTAPTTTQSTNPYQVDAERNEAIVDDAGVVTVQNAGNARVFYQIFVGSFSDSNGDGIGDLRGIINRFDYLNDGDDNSGLSLGVEGIWLTPIFKSPTYHKYDVTDYYKVDPQFGTEEDLRELIELCHSRNVKLIIDLPINHTAKNNQWFQMFVNAHQMADTESEYYEYYTYTSERVGSRTFSNIPGTSELYECNFSTEMPELNFDSEIVRAEMVNVAKYYLDMGIDGFRFDAAKYIYYGEDTRSAQFWEWYLAQLRAIQPDIYTVAEVWSGDSATYPYFTSTNCFNFSMSQGSGMIAQTVRGATVNSFTSYVENYLKQIKNRNPDAMIVSFIANHDTDRSAGFLTVSSGNAYMAANLNLLLPGSPFIYYGEEIGMKGSRGGAQTDADRRLAMLWGDGDTIRDPSEATYKKSNQTNGTVQEQLPNGASLLNHYKKLIMIRKANPEIAYGEFKALTMEGSLGGFVSTYEGKSVAVLHNTATDSVQIDLAKVSQLAGMEVTVYAGSGYELNGTVLTIYGQTSVILR